VGATVPYVPTPCLLREPKNRTPYYFFALAFFLGDFFSKRDFASSKVILVASTSLESSTLILPFKMLCLPHLAFSILIFSSGHSWTSFSASFFFLSSMSSSTSDWERWSKSYFLFTLMNIPSHLMKGPNLPLPLVTSLPS